MSLRLPCRRFSPRQQSAQVLRRGPPRCACVKGGERNGPLGLRLRRGRLSLHDVKWTGQIMILLTILWRLAIYTIIAATELSVGKLASLLEPRRICTFPAPMEALGSQPPTTVIRRLAELPYRDPICLPFASAPTAIGMPSVRSSGRSALSGSPGTGNPDGRGGSADQHRANPNAAERVYVPFRCAALQPGRAPRLPLDCGTTCGGTGRGLRVPARPVPCGACDPLHPVDYRFSRTTRYTPWFTAYLCLRGPNDQPREAGG